MTRQYRYLTLLVICLWGSIAHAASLRTVVIDAGHGGQDLGGSYGKVYEKHLALDTAFRLETQLKRLGYRTVMTRSSDNFITLPNRCRIANQYNNAIFVSIHYNSTWKNGVSGLETFYYNQSSRSLAQYIQERIVRRTRSVDRGAKFSRFYVIRHTNMPAVLVEGGFVSNPEERDRMKSAYFRESIATGIVEGIQRYRRSN